MFGAEQIQLKRGYLVAICLLQFASIDRAGSIPIIQRAKSADPAAFPAHIWRILRHSPRRNRALCTVCIRPCKRHSNADASSERPVICAGVERSAAILSFEEQSLVRYVKRLVLNVGEYFNLGSEKLFCCLQLNGMLTLYKVNDQVRSS